MKNKKYQTSTVEIVYFNTQDVVRTSGVIENGIEVPNDWGLLVGSGGKDYVDHDKKKDYHDRYNGRSWNGRVLRRCIHCENGCG